MRRVWMERRLVGGGGLLGLALGALLAAGLPGNWAEAQTVRQVTDVKTTIVGPPALDDAGEGVYAGSSADPGGGNPEHTFQLLRFDPSTGAATVLTSFTDGASALVSVSDDGAWLAFPSPADLTGGNHDQGSELFLMRSDGSEIIQLTDEPAVDGGSVSGAVLSGSGNRLAFVANTDPLGENAGNLPELFVIDSDGTHLRQLTHGDAGSIGGLSISDDGARVAFTADGDLTGGNGDLGDEVFAALADGSDLRQLTVTGIGYGSSAPSLSGGGQTVAFQSDGDLTGGNPQHQDEIFAIAFDGSGLRQLTTTRSALGVTGDPASQSPSIVDDGSVIFFHSNHGTLFSNLDGNYEIYRINADGTGLTMLTNTLLEAGSFFPVVSGGGSRVAFYGLDSGLTLRVMDGGGGNQRDLLTMVVITSVEPDITPDGARLVFARRTGVLGGGDIWRLDFPGGTAQHVTDLGGGTPSRPSVAGDGGLIVFSADSNPGGGLANLDGSDEVFRVQSDGTGLSQLTDGPAGTSSRAPVLARNGSVIVFDSDADLTGGNGDGSRELYRMQPDGSGLALLTNGSVNTTSAAARIDESGSWVAFESNADLAGGNVDGSYEIFRVQSGGSGLEQLTSDPAADSRAPDISADGGLIAFASSADLTGQNGDGNSEIFVRDVAGAVTRQLTDTTKGRCGGARLSQGGEWVYFFSDAPFFEDDPDTPLDLYRVPAAGGAVERVGALRAGLLGGVGAVGSLGGSSLAVDETGAHAVFSGLGDFTEANKDLLNELWLIDGGTPPRISVSKQAPTLVSWRHESGPLRYDVIRGDVALLGPGGGGAADLGPVVCLEDDSPDADTAGFEDPEQPPAGKAFFYLYRGSWGDLAGPGSYGAASGGGEREPASGGCAD